jgi:hypothetical protein
MVSAAVAAGVLPSTQLPAPEDPAVPPLDGDPDAPLTPDAPPEPGAPPVAGAPPELGDPAEPDAPPEPDAPLEPDAAPDPALPPEPLRPPAASVPLPRPLWVSLAQATIQSAAMAQAKRMASI